LNNPAQRDAPTHANGIRPLLYPVLTGKSSFDLPVSEKIDSFYTEIKIISLTSLFAGRIFAAKNRVSLTIKFYDYATDY
jgi:hypothetical protein